MDLQFVEANLLVQLMKVLVYRFYWLKRPFEVEIVALKEEGKADMAIELRIAEFEN
jgi:hypothetical protein